MKLYKTCTRGYTKTMANPLAINESTEGKLLSETVVPHTAENASSDAFDAVMDAQDARIEKARGPKMWGRIILAAVVIGYVCCLYALSVANFLIVREW